MPKITYTCPNCKEEFDDWGYRSRVGNPSCSKECEQITRHAGWRNKLLQMREDYKARKPIRIERWRLIGYLKQAKIICH